MNSATQSIKDVQGWVENIVLGLNLCPFAHRPIREKRVRFVAVNPSSREHLWKVLKKELSLLDKSARISNTLLIIENRELDFYEYLDLIDCAGRLMKTWSYEGVYQLASFHPRYCFVGEAVESRSHFTNRAPWPIIHILREEEISQALSLYVDPESIPLRNMKTLENLSAQEWKQLFDCLLR